MGKDLLPIIKRYPKKRGRQRFSYHSFLYNLVTCHLMVRKLKSNRARSVGFEQNQLSGDNFNHIQGARSDAYLEIRERQATQKMVKIVPPGGKFENGRFLRCSSLTCLKTRPRCRASKSSHFRTSQADLCSNPTLLYLLVGLSAIVEVAVHKKNCRTCTGPSGAVM